MSKIIVETISMFKMTYLVDDDNVEYAKDMVVCKNDENCEIHQEFLGETISSVQELSKKDYEKFLKSINMDKDVAKKYMLTAENVYIDE